jgi:hypothetical protein
VLGFKFHVADSMMKASMPNRQGPGRPLNGPDRPLNGPPAAGRAGRAVTPTVPSHSGTGKPVVQGHRDCQAAHVHSSSSSEPRSWTVTTGIIMMKTIPGPYPAHRPRASRRAAPSCILEIGGHDLSFNTGNVQVTARAFKLVARAGPGEPQ